MYNQMSPIKCMEIGKKNLYDNNNNIFYYHFLNRFYRTINQEEEKTGLGKNVTQNNQGAKLS